MPEYRLNVGKQQRIVWGTELDTESWSAPAEGSAVVPAGEEGRWTWDLPAGKYRAKDIVRELGVILDAISEQLGDAAKPEALLDNIEASLAATGRETTLPLGSLELRDQARSELAAQAVVIGETLARWAREHAFERRRYRHDRNVLSGLIFRSRCDHHLWTPEVTELLTGAAGGPSVMQLFNEYLHQIVLLRDGLLPFENWEEVPIELRHRGSRGLRYAEEAHAGFLSELLVKPIAHKSLVRYAQSLLAPELSASGYGFQYRLGTILPASLGADEFAKAPKYLLRWYPVLSTADASADDANPVAFVYSLEDYYSAARSEAVAGAPSNNARENGLPSAGEARLVSRKRGEGEALVEFRVVAGEEAYSADLGQIFRGHRYSYAVAKEEATTIQAETESAESATRHEARSILDLAGLATSLSGTHRIDAGGDELIRRALLGKLYPENIVLLKSGDEEERIAAGRTGKRFGAKFLVY